MIHILIAVQAKKKRGAAVLTRGDPTPGWAVRAMFHLAPRGDHSSLLWAALREREYPTREALSMTEELARCRTKTESEIAEAQVREAIKNAISVTDSQGPNMVSRTRHLSGSSIEEYQRFPISSDPPKSRKILRILCDEHVPRHLKNALGIRHLARARSIADSRLNGRSDHDILRWCIDNDHCLLTFDNDFLHRNFDWWRSPGVILCRIPSDKPHLWLPLYRVIILANRSPSQFNRSLSVVSAEGFKYHYKDSINRTRINDFRWFNGRLHRRVHPGEHLLDQGWTTTEVTEMVLNRRDK
jgi:hypothetical protein